jgi:hypothetical protein
MIKATKVSENLIRVLCHISLSDKVQKAAAAASAALFKPRARHFPSPALA